MSDSEFVFYDYMNLKELVIKLHDIASKVFDINPILSEEIRSSANELDLDVERYRSEYHLQNPQKDLFS